MRATGFAAVVIAGVAVLGFVGSAAAQAPAVPQAKGVKSTNLVTSLGGFREVVSIPVVLTGQTVEIEPGGQTGRQRHTVPTFIYVLEGTLVSHQGKYGPGSFVWFPEGEVMEHGASAEGDVTVVFITNKAFRIDYV